MFSRHFGRVCLENTAPATRKPSETVDRFPDNLELMRLENTGQFYHDIQSSAKLYSETPCFAGQ